MIKSSLTFRPVKYIYFEQTMFSLDESFQTTCSQLVTTLTGVYDLLRSCPDNSDTVPLSQSLQYKAVTIFLYHVSNLLERP